VVAGEAGADPDREEDLQFFIPRSSLSIRRRSFASRTSEVSGVSQVGFAASAGPAPFTGAP